MDIQLPGGAFDLGLLTTELKNAVGQTKVFGVTQRSDEILIHLDDTVTDTEKLQVRALVEQARGTHPAKIIEKIARQQERQAKAEEARQDAGNIGDSVEQAITSLTTGWDELTAQAKTEALRTGVVLCLRVARWILLRDNQ